MQISIVGLGLYARQLTLEAVRLLKSDARVILRTGRCEAGDWLKAEGVDFETLDALYDDAEDFDALNERMAEYVAACAKNAPVVYGVLDLRDESAALLAATAGLTCDLVPGVPVDGGLYAYAQKPALSLAAVDFERARFEASQGAIVREIASQALAGEVKLKLMERYPEERPVTVLIGGAVQSIALCDLDRLDGYDHTTCAFIAAEDDIRALTRYGINELMRIVHILRAPGGCPWDRAQTHETLRTNVVEEAWEVVDAINLGDVDALYDELGDLLMQVAIHTEIAEEHGEFTLDDVTSAISSKLISRHRHIFADADASTPDEVLNLWEQVKREERGLKTPVEAMRAVTKSLPALMRAKKVVKKSEEETGDALASLKARLGRWPGDESEAALGGMLMDVVRLAQRKKIAPEQALGRAIEDFIAESEQKSGKNK